MRNFATASQGGLESQLPVWSILHNGIHPRRGHTQHYGIIAAYLPNSAGVCGPGACGSPCRTGAGLGSGGAHCVRPGRPFQVAGRACNLHNAGPLQCRRGLCTISRKPRPVRRRAAESGQYTLCETTSIIDDQTVYNVQLEVSAGFCVEWKRRQQLRKEVSPCAFTFVYCSCLHGCCR